MKKIVLTFATLLFVAAGCKNAQTDNAYLDKNNNQNNTTQQTSALPSSQVEDVLVQGANLVPNTRRFTSKDLGLTFTYLKTPFQNVEITVTEVSNKIYVHGINESVEAGQSIEVFDKDPKLTLKQAIEERFLKDVSSRDCFVVTPAVNKDHPTQVMGVISYPDPDPSDDLPAFASPNNCPVGYSETNALQYFMMDKKYPDRFFFIKVGQDSITSDGSKPMPDGSGKNWSASVEVINKLASN